MMFCHRGTAPLQTVRFNGCLLLLVAGEQPHDEVRLTGDPPRGRTEPDPHPFSPGLPLS